MFYVPQKTSVDFQKVLCGACQVYAIDWTLQQTTYNTENAGNTSLFTEKIATFESNFPIPNERTRVDFNSNVDIFKNMDAY